MFAELLTVLQKLMLLIKFSGPQITAVKSANMARQQKNLQIAHGLSDNNLQL